MSIIPLQKINFEDIENQEEWFYDEILSDQEKSDLALIELEEFFENKSKAEKRDLIFPQYIWYTRLVWDRLRYHVLDRVIYGVSQQLPMAILLGYDVVEEIMWYLGLQTSQFIENEREDVYSLIRKAFFESDAVLGEDKGKIYTIKDIMQESEHINKIGGSMEMAEFDAKVKRIMFPKSELAKKYFTEDQDAAVSSLFDTINFFTTVEPEMVSYGVEEFLHPKIETGSKKDEVKKNEPISYQNIKQQIESHATKDGSGAALSLEEIFSELDRLAKENNDDRIRELFYFNEKSGKFEWNEELLKGSK